MPFQSWKDLKDFGKHLGEVAGVFAVVTTAVPLVGLAWDYFVPPFPPKAAPVIATIASAAWVLFMFFEYSQHASNAFGPAIRWHKLFAAATITIYAMSFFEFMGRADSTPFVRTPWLTTNAQNAVQAGKATADDDSSLIQYLGGTDDQQNGIWQYRRPIKGVLLISFSAFFVSLAGCCALYVLKQMAKDAGR
jgi:hypothetical protein